VKIYEVVIGKFLASFVFLALTISLSFTLPLTVKILGSPDFGVIICGYLGLLLMGAAYLAIGCFISSLTENQIIAFILSCVFIFLMLIIGESMILFTVPKFLVPILEYLGLGSHFESIGRGIIDSRDIVYYLSIIVFFLILNATFLEQKK
jgi:ABC-2 type transport system permease protein